MSVISRQEQQFWNGSSTVEYFADKLPDPRIIDFLESHYAPQNGLKALDLGCGGGRHSELLAAYGFDLDSVDVNPAMLEKTAVRLKAKNLEGNVQNGSILKLPFKDERFDIVVATGVLHQAKSIDEYKAAISELGRVTAPSGAVLLNIFTNDVWDDSYNSLDDTHNAVITKEGLGMTLLSKESFVEYMNDARFNLEVDYGVDIKQENTGARAVFRAVFRKEAKGAS